MAKILAVDLEHSFWSIALGGGLKSITAITGIVTSEIRGLAKNYDHVAVAVGVRGVSFRAAYWPGYKAKRKERADALWGLLGDTVKACEAEGWAIMRATEEPEGWLEADDVLATIARWCYEQGHSCDILTGDSDLCQCVSDAHNLRMLRRYKGITALDEQGVLTWMGHTPSDVAPIKMLAGDGGDGYGDVFPGFGDVKAVKALRKHGNPESVIEAARVACAELGDKAPAEARILWADGRGPELLRIAGILARVRTDVPLDLDSILVAREPKPLEAFGADMLPPYEEPEEPVNPRLHRVTPELARLIDERAPDSSRGFGPSPLAVASQAALDRMAAKDAAMPPEVEGEPVLPPQRPAAASSALTVVDTSARLLVPASEARNRMAEFVAFVRNCLTPNVDYGKIDGCGPKPILFNSGADKMAEVYGYAPEFEVVTSIERWGDDGADPLFYYSFRCRLFRKSDHIQVAECIGSCNSRETKYSGRWVKESQVPPHLDLKRLKRREFTSKFGADKGQIVVQFRAPNEEIFDQINTFQKMAQKRAKVGAIIIATRAANMFTQDLEDVPAMFYGNANEVPQWDL